MENKNDWDELEKWNTQRIINEKEKSKSYFEEFRKNKKIEKFSKKLNVTGWVLRIIAYIIISIAVIIGVQILAARISSKL